MQRYEGSQTHISSHPANAVQSRESGFSLLSFVEDQLERVAPAPWAAVAGGSSLRRSGAGGAQIVRSPLYTPEERERRDKSVWTLVQGILAPLQFLVFLVSLALVIRALTTDAGHEIAALSVVVKTMVLYTIMITGSIWEKIVFGKWLFAPAFFWEDVVSMGVIALHTLYVAAYYFHWGSANEQLIIALAAYVTYVINAAQFLWKLRMARLEGQAAATAPTAGAAA